MVRYSLTVPLLALASSLTGVLARDPGAEDVQDIEPETIIKNRWIVMVEEDADPSLLREKLRHDDIKIRIDYDSSLMQGASIELTNPETSEELLEMFRGLDRVIVGPVKSMGQADLDISSIEDSGDFYKRDTSQVDTTDPLTGLNFDSTHEMTQVSKLHALGHRGKGVNIAIVDSGVDFKHPDLGGCFGPGCLVDRGHDFVGDDYDGFSEPVPDEDPMDCAGSGTHMAGIIAAQGKQWKFTGAAPEATLGVYRVFGCRGNTETDILLSAFQAAYEDGANVITSSISRPSGWSKDPWAIGIQRIIKSGVPCILPAGNNGDKGMFFASAAASAKDAYAVGSVDNVNTPKLEIPSNYSIDGGDPIEFEWTKGSPYKAWGDVQDYEVFPVGFDVFAPANGCSKDDYGPTNPDLTGKVVLVRRGGCEILVKTFIATSLGAKYVIMYNNAPGTQTIDALHVPYLKGFAMVTPEVGEAWINEISAGKKVTLSMINPWNAIPKLSISANTDSGGSLSNFTSWGPTWEMDVRPLVVAPGANILSTFPQARGSYAVFSGTATSASLLAAITALVGSVRGTFHPKVLQSLLANYAAPQNSSIVMGSENEKFLAPVPQQGAGLVQAYDAAFGNTLLPLPYILFSSKGYLRSSLQFAVSNVGYDYISYKIEHRPALTAYGKESSKKVELGSFPNEMTQEYAEVSVSETEFTLAPMEKKMVTINAIIPMLEIKRLPVWSGYMVITASDDTKTILPYQGMSGFIELVQTYNKEKTFLTFIPGDEAVPYQKNHHVEITSTQRWVLPRQGSLETAGNGRSGAAGVELPGFQVSLAVGTPVLRADLVPVSPLPWYFGSRIVLGLNTVGQHSEFPMRYATRGTYVYAFDGKLADGRYVPPGEYKWVFRALRANGNSLKPDDYMVFGTISFRITYENMVSSGVVEFERGKQRPKLIPVSKPIDSGLEEGTF
ncbi:hypothetical protein BROUX41_004201 [Berkeleyomyces rouxiae]